jgi:hypothetical protein
MEQAEEIWKAEKLLETLEKVGLTETGFHQLSEAEQDRYQRAIDTLWLMQKQSQIKNKCEEMRKMETKNEPTGLFGLPIISVEGRKQQKHRDERNHLVQTRLYEVV